MSFRLYTKKQEGTGGRLASLHLKTFETGKGERFIF